MRSNRYATVLKSSRKLMRRRLLDLVGSEACRSPDSSRVCPLGDSPNTTEAMGPWCDLQRPTYSHRMVCL